MYFQILLLTFPALIYGKLWTNKQTKVSFSLSLLGDCVVNLDKKSGEHPPMLLQNGDFIYPTSDTEENGRIISIGIWFI